MKAMSLKGGELAIREVPRPVPGSGQILVRTLACAICATDHHYVDHPRSPVTIRPGCRCTRPTTTSSWVTNSAAR